MSNFRRADSLHQEALKGSDGYSVGHLCGFNEGGVCSLSARAVEQGLRRDLIACSTTLPQTCPVYQKIQRGQTIGDIYGVKRK